METEKHEFMGFAVGGTFPGTIPPEGPLLEVSRHGSPTLTMQLPGMSRPERKALTRGFTHYALHTETVAGITLLTWVFRYPPPIGFTDLPFHAGLYNDDRGHRLTEWDGNALLVIGLDGATVTHLRQSGLHPRAVDLFRRIAARQIRERPEANEYDKAVAELRKKSPEVLFKTGYRFRHAPALGG